jgi:hypothetical protein
VNQLIIDAQTQYNGGGLKKATDGLRSLEAETSRADKSAVNMTGNYDNLAKKMAQPLGRVAFRSLATEIIQSSTAMSGAGQGASALAAGFSSLGSAAMYMSGPIAAISIGLLGLIAIYRKLNPDVAESVKKHDEETLKLYESTKAFKEKVSVLENAGRLNKEQVSSLDASIAKQERKIALDIEESKQEVIKAKVRLDSWDAEKMKGKMTEEGIKANRVSAQLAYDEAVSNQIKMSSAETKMLEDSSVLRKKISDMNMENFRREQEAGRSAWESQSAVNMKLEQQAQKRYSNIQKYTTAASNLFKAENGKILGNAREVMAQEVQSFANMIASKLEMQAALDWKNPFAAAISLAKAVAVRGLGSAAAAAIVAGGQSSGGSASSAPSSAAGGNYNPNNQTESRPMTTINVNVTGDYIGEPTFIKKLADKLSEATQQGDVQLNASSARYLAPSYGPGV